MCKVWFDFGDGEIQEFAYPTMDELNAFLEGVSSAANAFGIDDYRQYDSEEELPK